MTLSGDSDSLSATFTNSHGVRSKVTVRYVPGLGIVMDHDGGGIWELELAQALELAAMLELVAVRTMNRPLERLAG